MPDILAQIALYKRQEIAQAKSQYSLYEMQKRADKAPPLCGFYHALKEKNLSKKTALIAEIKKASPSKGVIRENFSPLTLAQSYEAGGATCLSVLTDKPSFQGEADFLIQARSACSLPILRKDFMFDPYQVVEARAWGADCILVIMAIVTDAEAKNLHAEAQNWNMDVLFEIHNEIELKRVYALISAASYLIGVNNRNLHNFEVNIETTLSLVNKISKNTLLVSESGIQSKKDIDYLKQYGIYAYLVGESLMRQKNVVLATKKLIS